MKRILIIGLVLVLAAAIGVPVAQSVLARGRPVPPATWTETTLLINHDVTLWDGTPFMVITNEETAIKYQMVGEDCLQVITREGLMVFNRFEGHDYWYWQGTIYRYGFGGYDQIWTSWGKIWTTTSDLPWTERDDDYRGERWVIESHDDVYEVRPAGEILDGEQEHTLYGIRKSDSRGWGPL